MRRGDRFVFLALCLMVMLSLFPLFFRGGTARYARVSLDGELVERVDLQGEGLPRRIEVLGDDGSRNVILVDRGRIRMEESNCPDGLCVRRGWLERPGATAVCLPHRVMISVEGEGDLDAISR